MRSDPLRRPRWRRDPRAAPRPPSPPAAGGGQVRASALPPPPTPSPPGPGPSRLSGRHRHRPLLPRGLPPPSTPCLPPPTSPYSTPPSSPGVALGGPARPPSRPARQPHHRLPRGAEAPRRGGLARRGDLARRLPPGPAVARLPPALAGAGARSGSVSRSRPVVARGGRPAAGGATARHALSTALVDPAHTRVLFFPPPPPPVRPSKFASPPLFVHAHCPWLRASFLWRPSSRLLPRL